MPFAVPDAQDERWLRLERDVARKLSELRRVESATRLSFWLIVVMPRQDAPRDIDVPEKRSGRESWGWPGLWRTAGADDGAIGRNDGDRALLVYENCVEESG